MNKHNIHLDLHADTSGKHYANAVYGELSKVLDKWHGYEQKWRLYRFVNFFSSRIYGQLNRRIHIIHWPQRQPIIFPYLLVTFLVLLSLYLLYRYRNKFMPRKTVPNDTVLVYGVAPAHTVPTLSPYTLKLETYLRMAKIPYEFDMSGIQSSEGKNPWITYNGQDVADSQGCIRFLNKKRDVDLNKNLSPEERAVSGAFRHVIDEDVSWALLLNRLVYEPVTQTADQLLCPAPHKYLFMALATLILKRKAKSAAMDRGLFQKGRDFVNEQAISYLDDLSNYLGNKPYFMGDKPSEIDASLFGMVAQYLWTAPTDGPIRPKFDTQWSNLTQFCNRMKESYWPDWEQRIKNGKNGQANQTAP